MNTKELLGRIEEELNVTKKGAKEVLDTVVKIITEELEAGNEIAISGFGKFSISERAERKGRNPKTGDEITIAASKSAKFKQAKALKEKLN